MTLTNTIGTARVSRCNSAATVDVTARMTSGASATNSAAFLRKRSVAASPAVIHPHVAADAPAQFLKALLERGDAGLSFLIVRGEVHLNPDAPRALALLRARHERPSGR